MGRWHGRKEVYDGKGNIGKIYRFEGLMSWWLRKEAGYGDVVWLKDVFSSRDEIGTCPSIEVNIEVTDNSVSFIRPYHVKEEDRAVLDKEMRRLCYLGILKEGFLAYSSPVMLISERWLQIKE